MNDNPSSRYTEAEEAQAAIEGLAGALQAYADMIRRQAAEPRNAPIAEKIREIARWFDGLG